MTAASLGPGQMDLIVELGRRRKGITVVEVAWRYDIPHNAAWRAIQRLVTRGRLFKTDHKRKRTLLFEHVGRGATVYKTKLRTEDTDG